jgi:hypothetical protein
LYATEPTWVPLVWDYLPRRVFVPLSPSAPCIAPDASGAFERYGSRVDSSPFVIRRPQNSAHERERMKAPCQLIQKETDHKKLSEMVAELKCLADKKGSVAGRGYGRAEVSSFQSVVHLQALRVPRTAWY